MNTLAVIPTIEGEEVRNEFSWEVQSQPIYDRFGEIIPGHKVLNRSDNGSILNVCKETYEPTRNEVFTELVYRIADLSGYEIQNFSEFQNGKKVLAFLKAPETSVNGFKIENFLAVGNSHDSSTALFMANTQHMVRCANQFSHLNKKALKVYHTSGQNTRIKAVEQVIRLYNANQKALHANYELLQAKKVNDEQQETFIRHMLDIEANVLPDDLSSRKFNQAVDLNDAIEREKRDLGMNAFALLNGVTFWTTHVRKQKEKTFGNVFGANANYNSKALDYLLN